MQKTEMTTRHRIHPGIFLFQLIVFSPLTVILVGMEAGPTILGLLKGTMFVQSVDWSWLSFSVLFGLGPIGLALLQFVFGACVVEVNSRGIRCRRLLSEQQLLWVDVLMFRKSILRLKLATATTELTIPLLYVARSRELSNYVMQKVDRSCVIDDDDAAVRKG